MVADMNDILKKVKKANEHWMESNEGRLYDLQYDHDADIFYMTFGSPREAFSISSESSEEEVYLRIDAETYEIVGMDIMLFKSNFLPNHTDAKSALNPLFDLLGNTDWRVQIKEPSDFEEGEVSLLLPGSTPPEFIEYIRRYVPKTAGELVPA